jgi:hypothetical protein
MGRASFGGAADYSGVFAGLYNQAASERKSQIDNAMNEAKRVAQAEDESMIEAWKKGTVSDADLLARLAMRRDEAMDDVDKSAFASLYNEYKEAIADGKATIKFAGNPAGLINYYKTKLKGLNPNSAGYRRAQLEIIDLTKQLTPSNDGRKNSPETLAKIDAFVGDETDYKLLLVQAYEGGMNTWPPSTSHGLTQPQVDLLIEGASTYDVPTGGAITPEYIDGLDAEILAAIDSAIGSAPIGSKTKYTTLRTKYLADHVTLHNDFQQQTILTDPDTGILTTALAGLADAAKGITDPADLKRELAKVRDVIKAHFAAAGLTVATGDNTSGGATSNEYQILGDKMVAVMDDMIAGKTSAAQAVSLLSSTIAGFPDSKDNWVGLAFSDDILKSIFLSPTGEEKTVFEKMEYYAKGYAGLKTKPPTTAFVYDYDDGGGFVPVREVTKMVNGKPVKTYEPMLPVQEPKEDGTVDAWTMVAMDIDGKPTLVPALATMNTTNVPMAVFDPATGQMLTDTNKISELYKKIGRDIVNYVRPAVQVYTLEVGTGAAKTSYTYIGGSVSSNGTLQGGTWLPTDQVMKAYQDPADYSSGDKTLDALLKSAGVTGRLADENPYVTGVVPGEPIVYLGDNRRYFHDLITGKAPGGEALRAEALRHGAGFNAAEIDPYDEQQVDAWIDAYETGAGTGFPTGVGGRPGGAGGTSFGGRSTQPKGGLSTPEAWNAASEGKALFHYDKDYVAYTNVPPKKDPNDPIAQILGEEEEEPFRYAPRVAGNAFGRGAVAEYAGMAKERDRNALPKISIADSWDRGIQTLPKPPAPAAPTPPTSPTPTPPTAPAPGPNPPKPPAGPRPI